MISMNNVQLLGKITLPPKVRTLKSGTKLAEIGMGIPESYKKQDGNWETRMHFVDVVVWDQQAEMAEERLKKGDGLLVQGMLQYDQWEGKDGSKRSKVRVKAQRIQKVQLPDRARKEEAA
jgi:single-strand DNA-binding protein